jgi:predicted nuclease with TOPRIM domain
MKNTVTLLKGTYVSKKLYFELLDHNKRIAAHNKSLLSRCEELKKSFDELVEENKRKRERIEFLSKHREIAEEKCLRLQENNINLKDIRKTMLGNIEYVRTKLKFWRTGAWIATAAFAITLISIIILTMK